MEKNFRVHNIDIKDIDEVEISASRGPVNVPWVRFGISYFRGDDPLGDVSWISEGIADSISENWEEFQDIADQAEVKCLTFFASENNKCPSLNEDVVKSVSLQILAEIMGPCSLEFSIDDELTDLGYLVSDEEASLIMYSCIDEIFAVSFGVWHIIKKDT